jgi:hypothetical protein
MHYFSTPLTLYSAPIQLYMVSNVHCWYSWYGSSLAIVTCLRPSSIRKQVYTWPSIDAYNVHRQASRTVGETLWRSAGPVARLEAVLSDVLALAAVFWWRKKVHLHRSSENFIVVGDEAGELCARDEKIYKVTCRPCYMDSACLSHGCATGCKDAFRC